MSVVYNDTLKTGRLQLMSDLVAGKTFSPSSGSPTSGQLVIGTSGLSGGAGILVIIPLLTTPFIVSGNVATLQGVPLTASASSSGTAALAELRNNGGTTVCSGLTVGTDVIISSTSITSGQPVTVTACTIVHG